MKTGICGVLGLLITLGVATAQQKSASADEAALRAIEEKWDAASLKGDAAGLATIYADGFITTDPEGRVRSKAEALRKIGRSEISKCKSGRSQDLHLRRRGGGHRALEW
jgi:ketosteroid isomerase-like protein